MNLDIDIEPNFTSHAASRISVDDSNARSEEAHTDILYDGA